MRSSLERIDPDTVSVKESNGFETLQLHLERYRYAAKFLKEGICGDIACGTGYGSYLLASGYSSYVKTVIAVDIDLPSIEHANKRYAHPAIQFICTDAQFFKSPTVLNNIISLETIEHLVKPKEFIYNLTCQLQKGGRFIASVPITPSMDANPYHLHDFTKTSFIKLMEGTGLALVDFMIQVQPYQLFSVLNKKDGRSKDLRKGILAYYIQHPSKFFLRLRSLLKDGFNNKYIVAVFEKL